MNIIPKFQQGGWSQFFAGATYPSQQLPLLTTSTTLPTLKKESSELTIKDVFNLIKDVKGLPNDMALLTLNLQNMYALYERTGDVDALARMYLRNLYQLKVNVFNEKEYEDAKKLATTNGALEEYAITPAGKLVVQFEDGTIQEVFPSEYPKLNRNCAILTNNDLLNLRALSPNLINDNSVLSIVNNGIGMELVSDLILKHFKDLGTDEFLRTGPTWTVNGVTYGAYDIIKDVIAKLNGGFTLYGEYLMREDGVYNTLVISKLLTLQFLMAMEWLLGSLPKNALLLLNARAAVDNIDPYKLLTSLLGSTMSSTNNIKFTLDEDDTTSGSRGSSGTSTKDILYGIASEWIKGYGTLSSIKINPGNLNSFYLTANALPIADNANKITGGNYMTVKELEGTSFGSILQVNNSTICGKRLGTIGSSSVYLASNKIYNVDFPIDPNDPYANTPSLSYETRMNLARLNTWAALILKININDQELRALYVEKINEKARELGLSDLLLNTDGSYNDNWKNFGVMEVIFEEGVIDLDLSTLGLYTKLTDLERDDFIRAMRRLEGNKNYEPNGDLYKTTVWIPVDNYLIASVLGLREITAGLGRNLWIGDNRNNTWRTPVNINTNTTGK